MKSIKSKLFVAYSITIFIVLLLLSSISLSILMQKQESNNLTLLETTYASVEYIIINKKEIQFRDIEKNNNIFLIINKDKKLLYSDFSLEKNSYIIESMKYKQEHYSEDDHEYGDYTEVDDYIINYKEIKKDNVQYDVYIGINENTLDQFLDDIYEFALIVNIILYILLLILGYIIINKTIHPLKLILDNLAELEIKKDLSLRLNKQNTNDEFEKITQVINNMFDWIENSVANTNQFSSDASHELRTPLTVIQGEIELCKKRSTNKEEIDNTILKIDFEQKKLQNIISDFLLLSKLDNEVLNKRKTSLDKVIFDVIESNLVDLEKKGLELKLDIDDDNLEIEFNEKYLFIVINNLFTNAIKYTENGFIKINAKKEDNLISFSIQDSGIGIQEKETSKVFERFYRVDNVRTHTKKGIGLGLAIVKKICERFDYKIKIESQINEGSTFTIYQ